MISKTRDMILVGIFAALVAIGAFIKIPLPVIPFTLQFLFVVFAGVLLGSKKGALAVIIYIAIGLSGLPVFAKGGGFGYVFQPSFGYLLGFIACAFTVGWVIENMKELSIHRIMMGLIGGWASIYCFGLPYMYYILNVHLGKSVPLDTVIKLGFTPFIITDAIQLIIIAVVSFQLIPRLRSLGMSLPVVKPVNE